jgi:serine/threonine protein kinase
VKYLHSAGVIHRDLKPSNLLVNHDCDLKICDFGLARGYQEAQDAQLTEYVVTRHYRAPEVMTNAKRYDAQIDVWSVGCIFAELLGRKPLFPGSDYLEQLRLIINRIGSPSSEDLADVPTPAARSYIESLGNIPKANWKLLFPTAHPLALDLLDSMLHFNPKKRITVDQALKHAYFKTLHRDSAIQDAKSQFDFAWEKQELDEEKIQSLIWDEIGTFRSDVLPERQKMKQSGALKDFVTMKREHIEREKIRAREATAQAAQQAQQAQQQPQQAQPQQQQQQQSASAQPQLQQSQAQAQAPPVAVSAQAVPVPAGK